MNLWLFFLGISILVSKKFCFMAFGDPIDEGACLLPGGSRVEALDVENLSKHTSKRGRFSSVVLACSIAVAACIAVVAVQNFGVNSSSDLLDTSTVKSVAEPADDPTTLASTSRLPSWLRTGPVKLMPLDKLIREQEMVHQMAEGKVSAKLYKQEHMQEGPSPHQLAMHSVHIMAQEKQRRQQLLAQKPSHHRSPHSQHGTAEMKDDPTVKKAVHALHEKARGMRERKEKKDATSHDKHHANHGTKLHHAHVGKVGHVVKVHNVAEELAKDEDLLRMIEKGEAKQEAEIKKQELHRLAVLKRKDHVEEINLEKKIKNLKEKFAEEKNSHEESSAPAKLIREKAKLKAEMARVEEEEQEKLKALKAKLDQVSTSKSHDVKSSTTELAGKPLKPKKLASTTEELASGDVKKQTAKKPACNKDDCNLDQEDKKWLAHKKSVDYYAKIAQTGHGVAKREAVQKMKELEHQITHDYHHVTSFAVAQEYALPPAPNS